MTKENRRRSGLEKDPLWYKNGIIYELHVRSFLDTTADGTGDFRGLTQKLDYLKDLGITAIWLLPFYPSPLKDDGYDISDYYSIHPTYGTLADFKVFLREAHRRGLRVITELVVNHTSDQHPWFQRSRRAKPGSKWRDFYVWSDTPDKYKEARIIFKDFETSNWSWDPVAKAYFWHRFYSHQPDLNYDNPLVHREIIRVLDFWLDMGVDGLRLDAVPYLYEREGTSCENLPETHEFLKKLRKHIDEKYEDRMLLGEANQWPEDSAAYFGSGKGDECHMAFHFPLMPRLFMAIRLEDRVPIVDILEQTPPIPETSQWALFLRNHDELTLEMVTDEERDYMYRVYANDIKARINLGIRRRLAPLLGNDRKRIELLNLLLFSLPGTPVLYYGDEIGMGENIYLGDRNGVRTPMHWSSDKNAGFSRANPQALYLPIILDPEYHYEAVNVEAQQRNPHSLLWWMKRVLILRKRWKAFGQGTMEFLHPENRKILAFIRRYEQEILLVVANLSRFTQPVQLDLSAFEGSVPVELFGRTPFPIISKQPYLLTLSPHAALWFALEPQTSGEPVAVIRRPCETLVLERGAMEMFDGRIKDQLEACLPNYVQERRWFGGKGRTLKWTHVRDAIPLHANSSRGFLLLIGVEYVQGDPEDYLLPVELVFGQEAEEVRKNTPERIVAQVRMQTTQEEGVLYESVGSRATAQTLFDLIARRRTLRGKTGEVLGSTTSAFRGLRAPGGTTLEPSVNRTEQSNTAIVFGDRFFLKLFRRLEAGPNPDFELGNFLTQKEFPNISPVAGSLEFRREVGDPFTLGILTGFVPGSKDAWSYTLDALSRYFERVRALPAEARINWGPPSLLDLAIEPVPTEAIGILGTYVESARLLGERTGQMHLVLASDPDNEAFAPEPFTPFYQRSIYQSMRNLAVRVLGLLRRNKSKLPESIASEAAQVCEAEGEILKVLRRVCDNRIASQRIRVHGDFHLGQVLYTGKDFIIIDFEGEPAKPLSARRIKRSPLRDVAGMIRSFDYAVYTALLQHIGAPDLNNEMVPRLLPWTRFWHRWVSAVYLNAYLGVIGPARLLPESKDQLQILLDSLVLEKAVYEIGYELNNRPDWIPIPLRGILEILKVQQS